MHTDRCAPGLGGPNANDSHLAFPPGSCRHAVTTWRMRLTAELIYTTYNLPDWGRSFDPTVEDQAVADLLIALALSARISALAPDDLLNSLGIL